MDINNYSNYMKVIHFMKVILLSGTVAKRNQRALVTEKFASSGSVE